MAAFHGVYVVNVTPFTADGKVDYPGLDRNIRWLVAQGVHGLIPLGSTGEFASLDDGDKARVLETVVAAAGGKVPVVAGISAETTGKAVANARGAARAGASGLLLLPPWYYTPDQDEIVEHYRRVAEATPLPMMVYNNPFTSKVDIQAATVERLAAIQGIEAVKESTGDIRRLTEIRTRTDDRMTLFCGWEDMAYESFLAGCTGWVCVIGNIWPRAAVELFDLVVEKRDLAAGWKLYKRMLPMLRFLEYAGKTQKALKHVLDAKGLAGGACSSPKLPLDEATRAQVDRLVREFEEGGSR
jgi:4-hydroxy-tetrahydrodipicolinate synthase